MSSTSSTSSTRTPIPRTMMSRARGLPPDLQGVVMNHVITSYQNDLVIERPRLAQEINAVNNMINEAPYAVSAMYIQLRNELIAKHNRLITPETLVQLQINRFERQATAETVDQFTGT